MSIFISKYYLSWETYRSIYEDLSALYNNMHSYHFNTRCTDCKWFTGCKLLAHCLVKVYLSRQDEKLPNVTVSFCNCHHLLVERPLVQLTALDLCYVNIYFALIFLFTSDKGGVKCFCPCFSLFACSLARLLKNACIDLDEMLRVDRCRDMDKLINFWVRSGL